MRVRKKINNDNHKKWFFQLAELKTEHLIFLEKMKYGPKCYSKATYDPKWALIEHPSFQLSNMNNGYNETRGNGTKWSCQNQIKSNQNQNQKSNPKQDFKLKPVSNAFSGYLWVCLLWDRNC